MAATTAERGALVARVQIPTLAKLRDLQPNVSIEWIKQYVPYTPRAMPHFLEGMRKAGVE